MTHLQPSPHPHSFLYCCLRWTNPVIVMVKDLVSNPFSSSGSLSSCTTGHVCFLFPNTYFYALSLSAHTRTNGSPVSCSCWSPPAAIPHGSRPLFRVVDMGLTLRRGRQGCYTAPPHLPFHTNAVSVSHFHTHTCAGWSQQWRPCFKGLIRSKGGLSSAGCCSEEQEKSEWGAARFAFTHHLEY